MDPDFSGVMAGNWIRQPGNQMMGMIAILLLITITIKYSLCSLCTQQKAIMVCIFEGISGQVEHTEKK